MTDFNALDDNGKRPDTLAVENFHPAALDVLYPRSIPKSRALDLFHVALLAPVPSTGVQKTTYETMAIEEVIFTKGRLNLLDALTNLKNRPQSLTEAQFKRLCSIIVAKILMADSPHFIEKSISKLCDLAQHIRPKLADSVIESLVMPVLDKYIGSSTRCNGHKVGNRLAYKLLKAKYAAIGKQENLTLSYRDQWTRYRHRRVGPSPV